MSRLFTARLATGILFLFLVLALPLPVLASQTPVQIKLSVSQASPGATIEVQGGRFPEDAMVKFVMQNAENQVSLGTVIADDHGEFSVTVLIPLDVQDGSYEFQAVDDKNQLATAPITIMADTSGQEGSDQRENDDGLLAPMPTLDANAPTPMLQSVSSSQSKPSDSSSIPYVWIAAGIGAILVLGLMVGVKRKR